MSKTIKIPISIFYYLAFAIAGVIAFIVDKSFFGQAMLVNYSVLALIGIIHFICFECVDEYSGMYTVLKVIKSILGIASLIFCSLIFFTGYFDQIMNGAMNSSFVEALKHACVFFPIVFVLLRSIVYSFTLENLEEKGHFVITLIFPVICYVLAVVMLMISTVWSFVVLCVIWLAVNIFIKGRLNAFEKVLFNLVYYGAFLAIGLSFAGTKNLLAVMAFTAMSFCFFLFIGLDLCRDTTVGYWTFNIIGMLGSLVFTIVALVFAAESGLEGLKFGLRCGFADAVKNAWLFMPLVYICLRPPLYKLSVENDWEDGLSDVFVSLLLPILCYAFSILFLLIGIVYILAILTAVVLIAMVVMAITDNYASIPDVATEFRTSVSGYVRSVTIIED